MLYPRLYSQAALIACLFLPGLSLAQQSGLVLEEVIVTAQKQM